MTWTYTKSKFDERWSGDLCDTRTQAITAGLDAYSGEAFAIGECDEHEPGAFMPDADEIIELIGERAHDNCGECAEGYPDIGPAARVELQALLDAWAKQHCVPQFWSVNMKSVEEIEKSC